MLACRRTTFEWVLRRMALDEGNVTFEGGRAVVGLVASDDARRSSPASGSTTGPRWQRPRRGRSRTALGPSRLARRARRDAARGRGGGHRDRLLLALLPPARGRGLPAPQRLIGGDLGYVKYGVFVGDNGPSRSRWPRRPPTRSCASPRRPVKFDNAARELVVAEPFLDGRAEPLDDDVHVMAGLLNRWRDSSSTASPSPSG